MDYNRFAKVCNDLRSLTRRLKSDYEENLVSNIKTNLKVLWKYVNSKMKTRLPVDTLKTSDNGDSVSNQDKANVLNEYFASVFTQEDLRNMPSLPDVFNDVPMADIQMSDKDKLCHLGANKSPGPDGWHPRFQRSIALELSKPLAVLFQKSLYTGIVPNDWKLADVAPVFKKDDRKLPSNYRPISLTPLICKVLESVIRDKMFDYLFRNNLLVNEQHGFMPRRSCVTQLLIALHYWTESLEKGVPVAVLYLGFSKAFDSVPHERLLLKLEAYGIQDKVL